jgi:hypothetical protein
MSDDSSYEAALMRTVVEELPEVIRLMPYAKHVHAAYRWIHGQRFKAFLSGLNAAADDLSREDRARFESYINSELGGEVLADFAEQAVRTRSRTALAALAILYAESETSIDRKAQTALSLEGISERSIDAFLLLYPLRTVLFNEALAIATLSNEVVNRQRTLMAAGWSGDIWAATIDDLLSRSLLGRDLSATGRLGGEEGWNRYFRFTADTDQYEALLSKARRHLDSQSALGLGN